MTITLRVHGLDCADEATELREALQSRPGVRELSFDCWLDTVLPESVPPFSEALRCELSFGHWRRWF